MEINYSKLKQKEVISLSDGRLLGRVCDLAFCFPENKVLGITVSGGRFFKFSREEIFIPMKSVSKIGEDAILVNVSSEKPCSPPPPPPKVCPPHGGGGFPNGGGPPSGGGSPPYFSPHDDGRRSYDEYE